jgi:hypothetical protein
MLCQPRLATGYDKLGLNTPAFSPPPEEKRATQDFQIENAGKPEIAFDA